MLWATTPSGKKWPLMTPSVNDVDFNDIAHNLAYQVRYNGTCGQYSIAEHSVHIHDEMVAQGMSPSWCLLALLHDAHEFILGDIITPVANALSMMLCEAGIGLSEDTGKKALNRLKKRTDQVIFEAAGIPNLPGEAYHQVKILDTQAMMTERDALQPNQPEPWPGLEDITRLSFKPECWEPEEAHAQFLDRLEIYLPDSKVVAA